MSQKHTFAPGGQPRYVGIHVPSDNDYPDNMLLAIMTLADEGTLILESVKETIVINNVPAFTKFEGPWKRVKETEGNENTTATRVLYWI